MTIEEEFIPMASNPFGPVLLMPIDAPLHAIENADAVAPGGEAVVALPVEEAVESAEIAEVAEAVEPAPRGTVSEILAWVDGDADKATQALEAENATGAPRKGLVAELSKLLPAAE